MTVEDLTYEQVRERLTADYFITVSIGTIHNWLKERNARPSRSRRRRTDSSEKAQDLVRAAAS